MIDRNGTTMSYVRCVQCSWIYNGVVAYESISAHGRVEDVARPSSFNSPDRTDCVCLFSFDT